MDFIEFIDNLFDLLGDGFINLINFVKSIPNLFYDFVNLIPSPFNIIVLSFIPLFILVLFYKFARGY